MTNSKLTGTASFHDTDREGWIRTINAFKESIKPNETESACHIDINFSYTITLQDLEPIHLVTLMCFIEHLHQIGYKVTISAQNEDVNDYLYNTLRLREYYEGEGASHVQSGDEKVLNLWKVKQKAAIAYSQSVTDYFNKHFFEGYDMSALKNALDEAYANIADHSESNDNAFSYIVYDSERDKICVAICDFGLGIPKTLRDAHKKYSSDEEALKDSINIGVSARTNERNKGFGLDNILSTLTNNDVFRIVSNKSILYCFGEKSNAKTKKLDFDFKGTLIYFEVSTASFPINSLEDEVIIG